MKAEPTKDVLDMQNADSNPNEKGSTYVKEPTKNEDKLFEKLAEIEHQRWSDWQKYVHKICILNKDNSLTIPLWAVMNWNRQINTKYSELSEKEKESDREQVRRYWRLIEAGRQSALAEIETLHKEIDQLKEQVRKLKDKIMMLETIDGEGEMDVICVINEIFPDCAEQPKKV